MEYLTYAVEIGREYDKRSGKEISDILGIPIQEYSMEFDPSLGKSLEIVASDRAVQAYNQLESSCIVVESSLKLDGNLVYNAGTFLVDHNELCRKIGDKAEAKIVLGYANGESAKIFQGDVDGIFVEPREISGTWWDSYLQPNGYGFTMAELIDLPYIWNKRKIQYIRLATFLDLPESRDIYEAHVTVECNSAKEWVSFGLICHELKIKAIQIHLDKGQYRDQVITATWHKGPLDRVTQEVYQIGEMLSERGFKPLRHKIEAKLGNTLVPLTFEEAQARPPEQYFEFHARVEYPKDAALDNLEEICLEHNAHLSRSASFRHGGMEKRFVTVRRRPAGINEAKKSFERLMEDLRGAGYIISNMLEEYNVFDSNPPQDIGWMEEPPCASCSEQDDCLFTNLL